MKLVLPASSGDPLMHATIKAHSQDFIVREHLGFELDGAGEHLYLYIQKSGVNTNDIVDTLLRAFDCRSVDIGVSGLKDKQAVTEQWFSVRSPKDLDDITFNCDDKPTHVPKDSELRDRQFAIVDAVRHGRKLRRGAHDTNEFVITLRDVKAINSDPNQPLSLLLQERLQLLGEHGFANYFGTQRFGFDSQNLVKAERYFNNPKRKITRAQRSILLSAARSHLFNAVCAERVKQQSWNRSLTGDAMLLTGTNSYFINDGSDSTIHDRCASSDIQPSGPLWGRGKTISTAECELLESAAMHPYRSFMRGLERAGLEQQRRSLRAHAHGLQHEWIDEQCVKLNFKLLKGVYATSLLAEFMINW